MFKQGKKLELVKTEIRIHIFYMKKVVPKKIDLDSGHLCVILFLRFTSKL